MKITLSFSIGIATMALAFATTQAVDFPKKEFSEIASFKDGPHQLPEGLTITDHRVYQGMATTPSVYRVNLDGQDKKVHARFP